MTCSFRRRTVGAARADGRPGLGHRPQATPCHHRMRCFVRRAGHVRSEGHVVHRQQRVVKGERFYREDVEGRPRRSAASEARVQQGAWSTIWPLATLRRIAPGFIFPNAAGPIMPRVAGVRGTWMETTSALDSSSSSLSGPPRTSTPRRAASSAADPGGLSPRQAGQVAGSAGRARGRSSRGRSAPGCGQEQAQQPQDRADFAARCPRAHTRSSHVHGRDHGCVVHVVGVSRPQQAV